MKLFKIKKWLSRQNGWVDVGDSLPRESEPVLTYRDFYPTYKVDYISHCDGSKWMLKEANCNVLYWKYIKGPY